MTKTKTKSLTRTWFRGLAVVMLMALCGTSFGQTVIIGTNSGANGTTAYPCPLGDYYKGQRAQYLYKAADFAAAGIAPGNTISALGWVTNATTITGHNQENYTIAIKNTTLAGLTLTTWETGFTTVYGPTSYAYPSGTAGNITFPVAFTYTGGDLIVEVCGGLSTGGYTSNPACQWQTLVGYNAAHTYRSDAPAGGAGCGVATVTNTGTATSRPRLVLTYAGANCSGVPAPGNTVSTANPVCSGANFTLSLASPTTGAGVTHQWQSSPDGSTWANIAGATTSTRIQTQSVATYYRCEVTCTFSASTTISNPLQVTMNNFLSCYCVGSANCAGGDHVTNVIFGAISNATGICLGSGGNPAYSDYSAQSTNVNQGSIYSISMSVNNGGTEYGGVWIDYDQSGTFDASEYTSVPLTLALTWDGTANITIPGGATLGTTRMRVRSKYSTNMTSADACAAFSYGETEDYTINILPPPVCSGTPTGGTAAATSPVCTGGSSNLSLTGHSTDAGVVYQWQTSSVSGGPYADISGATTAAYSHTVGAPGTEYVICVVTCTNSALSANSSEATISILSPNSFTGAQTKPTLVSNDVNSYSVSPAGTAYQWQTSAVSGGPWTNVAGATANPTALRVTSATDLTVYVRCSVTDGCVVGSSEVVTTVKCATPYTNANPGTTGDHIVRVQLSDLDNVQSAPYGPTNNSNYEDWTGLDAATLCKGSSQTIQVTSGASWSQGKVAWIDWNNNGSFGDAGEMVMNTTSAIGLQSATFTVPMTATDGLLILRVMCVYNTQPNSDPCFVGPYGFGEIEEYMVNVVAPSVAPTSITSTDPDNQICVGDNVNLTQAGGSLGSDGGAAFVWYTGSCGGSPAGTGPSITVNPSVTTTYFVRTEDVCDNAGACQSVTIVVSTGIPAASVPNPLIIAGLPASACNGTGPLAISVAPIGNATQYIWDAPAGTTINGTNPYTSYTGPTGTITFGSPAGSGYYIGIQAANACGATIRRSQWVRGTVGVPAAISPDNARTIECASTSAGYTTGAIVGATGYLWSVTGDATVVGAGTSATVTFGPSWTGGTLCVAAQTSCFTSATKCLALSTAPPVVGIMSGSNSVCVGQTIVYSVPAQVGIASYSWTLPLNATGSSSTNSISVTYVAGFVGGQISVTSTSICGVTSSPRVKNVYTGIATVPSSISGITNGLCGQTVIYQCPPQGGVTFAWTAPAGTINSGQGTNAVSVTFGTFTTPSTVCVTASNLCGTSAPRCITVNGRPNAPGAITSIPSSWCANASGVEFNVDVAAVTGSYTLSWLYPGAAVCTYLLGGGNSTSLIVDWINGSGPVNVTASNACGNQTRNSTQASSCREGEELLTSTSSAINVYPNPTSGNINLEFSSITKGNATVTVSDISGRTVVSQNISVVEGLNKAQLDLSQVSKGIYMMNVNSTQGNSKMKIVVE